MSNTGPHVAIIGGGIIGCCTAYFLTKLGYTNITIFEQCDIACHSSGKAAAYLGRCNMRYGSEDYLAGRNELARASFGLHMELAEQYPDLDYHRVDLYKVDTDTEEVLQATVGEADYNVKWLSTKNVRAIGLVETSENSAKVTPKLLCKKLQMEAELKGAKVIFSRVTGVVIHNSRVTKLQVADHNNLIAVDALVVAAGPWSTNFIHKHFPSYMLPQIGLQLRAHSVVLQPATPVDSNCIWQFHKEHSGLVADPEIYPRPDGTVYLCGEGDNVELPSDPNLVKPSIDRCKELIRKVSIVAECLGEAKVVIMQAGFLPDSPDHLPIIGKIPGIENAFVGTGHTEWGILLGPATGKCLAELIITGSATTCDIAPFNPSRFC